MKWSSNSILTTSWKNPANILGTSREHLENIKRTSIEYLEKIQKHLWSSENICEHLRTSEHILNTSENLYRISVINWGHPEKKCPHRGWLSIKVTTQLKTSKNSWEHWQTSKIIWYHPENNWGPIIDNLVQLEENFNSRKTSSENSRKTSENSWEHWKTSKIIWYHPENNWGPIIDNLDQLEEDFNSRKTSSENNRKTVGKHRKTAENIGKHLKSSDIILRTTEDPP